MKILVKSENRRLLSDNNHLLEFQCIQKILKDKLPERISNLHIGSGSGIYSIELFSENKTLVDISEHFLYVVKIKF
jgi:hypothetical protein